MEKLIQGLEDIKIKALKSLSKNPKNKDLKELVKVLDRCIEMAKNAR